MITNFIHVEDTPYEFAVSKLDLFKENQMQETGQIFDNANSDKFIFIVSANELKEVLIQNN